MTEKEIKDRFKIFILDLLIYGIAIFDEEGNRVDPLDFYADEASLEPSPPSSRPEEQ